MLLTTAMVGGSFFGYARAAYAICSHTIGNNYICTGYNTGTQSVNVAHSAYVSTNGTFGVNTAAGNAITITGDGMVDFTDVSNSTVTASANGANGIYLNSGGNFNSTPGGVLINTNSTITSYTGIYAKNYGSGDITIQSYGSITATVQGIYANNKSNASGNLSVTTGASSNITVNNNVGIRVYNHGTGITSVTVDGDVSSGGYGVYIANGYLRKGGTTHYGTNMLVYTGSSSNIQSGTRGIEAYNTGSGYLSIIANGNVTNTGDSAIYAINSRYGTSLSITTGPNSTISTSGSGFGIFATNNGHGELSIETSGDVTSSGSAGIYAKNYGTDLYISTAVNTMVSGSTYGIYARNVGAGALTIEASGDVVSTGGTGIFAINVDNVHSTDLDITIGGSGQYVLGFTSGIIAKNYGTGAVSVTANGNVTGSTGDGISVYNSASGTNLSVVASAGTYISGSTAGIRAKNLGSGTLNITTDSGSTVVGGTYGIYAKNYGRGDMVINAYGDVRSNTTGATEMGIYAFSAYNSHNAHNLTITTGTGTNISGYADGIKAKSAGGTGALTIHAYGDINASGATSYGIFTYNEGTTLNITTGPGTTVSGAQGIQARSTGTGDTMLAIYGDVTGSVNSAIFAYLDSGGNASITTHASSVVHGATDGISLSNRSGNVNISTYGDVIGTGGYGIYAKTYGTALNVTTGSGKYVTGGADGISLMNMGTGISAGAVTLKAYGNVTGTSGDGIYVYNKGTALNITTGASATITGGTDAIMAKNKGTGALNITTEGSVTGSGATSKGIYAYNKGTALNITTNAGKTVSGGNYGIFAKNAAGVLTIDAYGVTTDRSATAGAAIYGRNNATGTNLNITIGTAAVSGFQGIVASNHGSGAETIHTYGDITGSGANGAAIYAYNHGSALTITTDADHMVSGAGYGIHAKNMVGGALSITASGDVTGTNKDGIYAYNKGTGALNITTAASHTVTGADGIFAVDAGSGALGVNVYGTVTATGGSGIGVYAKGVASSNTITVTNGAAVSGNEGIKGAATTPLHVILDGTSSAVTVTGSGGTAIDFGNANDTLTLKGTVAISGNVTGGAGNNTLDLNATHTTLYNGGAISGFQTIDLTGESLIVGAIDESGSTINAANGSLHVNGTVSATTLTVGSGGEFGGNNTFTGNLIIGNGGTLAPGNSIGTINVTGNVTFNPGSTFEVQVAGVSSDKLNATGTVTIQPNATLEVEPLAAVTGSSITFLTADGGISGHFDRVYVDGSGLAAAVGYNPDDAAINFTVLTSSPVAVNTQALASLEDGTVFADTVTGVGADNAFERDRNYWIQGIYRNSDRQTNGNYTGFDDSVSGTAAGAEVPMADNWKLGFSLADIDNNTVIDDGLGKTSGNGSFISVYGTYTNPLYNWDMFTTFGVLGGYQNYDSKRLVSNGGVISDASSSSDSYETGALVEMGARSRIGDDGWYVMPKVGVDYIHVFANGYDEKSGGPAAVSINSYDFGTLRPSANVSLYDSKGMVVPYTDITVKPSVNFGVFREYAVTNRDVGGSFSTGAGFDLDLDRSSSTFATAGAGLDFNLAPGITSSVTYQGAFNNTESRNEARIGVRVEF